jgi:UDP-2-acetamido-2-deoxy-ribo-hexuluronate aminotransferase
MVDLRSQYLRLRTEIDKAIDNVLQHSSFIQGPEVAAFTKNLSKYIGGSHVVTCGNGTDGLQLALMAVDLRPGDEVIVPAFTYVATAEVISLLGLKAVLVDVDRKTFNIDVAAIERKITSRTRAIIPVHLFGQCSDMQALTDLKANRSIYIIEDAAQALGSIYAFKNGILSHAGTMGDIGVTSFFPSKSLGAFGDGGAVFCDDAELAERIRMVANHGQRAKYAHEIVGVNSRLDTLQAAVLDVKLRHLNDFIVRRQAAASYYDKLLAGVDQVEVPHRNSASSHVFHQYTLKVRDRDKLREHLSAQGIPTMIYYPLPLHHQKAYQSSEVYPVAEELCKTVISLPIHTEITEVQLEHIGNSIRQYYHA